MARGLSRRDWVVLLQAVLLLPIVWGAQRSLSLHGVLGLVGRLPLVKRRTLTLDEAKRVGFVVNGAANRLLGSGACLTRSLVLQGVLRRYGTQSDLRIGIRKVGEQFAAHAWVEIQGQPINDLADVATRFSPFDGPLVPGDFV